MFRLLIAIALAAGLGTSALAAPPTYPFTYQGRIDQGSASFTGQVDMVFSLFDDLTNGTEVATAITKTDVQVTDGVFQVELDFGPTAFDSTERYLAISIDGVPLTPRQRIGVSPVAMFALAGNPGPKGDSGPQGATGPQGPKGDQGDPGSSASSVLYFKSAIASQPISDTSSVEVVAPFPIAEGDYLVSIHYLVGGGLTSSTRCWVVSRVGADPIDPSNFPGGQTNVINILNNEAGYYFRRTTIIDANPDTRLAVWCSGTMTISNLTLTAELFDQIL